MLPKYLLPLLLLTLTACNRFGAPAASATPTHAITATATIRPTYTATPSPSPTATPTPSQTIRTTQTPTVVPTSRPTAYPTLPPGTPAAGPEGYHLKSLAENDIINLMDVDESNFHRHQDNASLTLGREFLLKYPTSKNRLTVVWRM